MMGFVDVLTWVFRSAFIVGAVLAFTAAIIWSRRSQGAWKLRPAGVMQMTMVLALGTVLGAVALRILTNLESTKRMLPGVDLAVLMVAAVAVWAVVAALARFLVLVLREQPDYRADHETEPNGSAERE